MLRSIWKGHIRFSLVTIPIRIYSAVDTAQRVRFSQLHKGCSGRIGYNKQCKKCSETVSSEDIVKGYQYEPDQYVVFEKDDIDKVKLSSMKVIEIEGFVDAADVHATLFETPYFAGPDGDVAAKTYSLLSAALRDSGKVGVGKVVLRDREDVLLIAAHESGILLHRLRYPDEIRRMSEVPLVDGIQVGKDELRLARSFVDSMSTTLDKLELKDRYHGALREMIEAKIKGKEIVTVQEEAKPVVDVMTALKQSIEEAKAQQKPMVKAKGRKGVTRPAKKTAAKAMKKTAANAKAKKRRTA